MPITRNEIESDVTVFEVRGATSAEEIAAAAAEFYRQGPTLHTIWDVSKGSLAGLSFDLVCDLARRFTHDFPTRRGGRTAIVASKAVDYGVARMIDAVATLEETPFAVRIFYQFDEALAWIRGHRGVQP